MIFNSLLFLVFFACVLLANRLIRSWAPRKAMLLAASYIFYGVWNPPFVLLLAFSTVVDWFVARALARANRPRVRRVLLILSLLVNLGLLAVFKYGQFFLESVEALLTAVGISATAPTYSIILPVGISFYTFQTLSYTIDVYRRKIPAADSFLDYALYVSFFPQLVAGPIVRASDFLPQCKTPVRATSSQFGWGAVLLALGLFQKVVLADWALAPTVERVYDAVLHPTFLDAWLATLSFSGQIYFDFSGYSSCAIGVAMCLGFRLPDNFRSPYAAIGFSDFWRRWHISLSTWLRDYLYIPLGGNRRGARRTSINLFLTMLLGGLWHGAAWTFVIWGGLHGLYLWVERLVRRGAPRTERSLAKCVGLALATYLAVNIAWVFFRASSLADAWQVLGAMAGLGSGLGTLTLRGLLALGVVFAMLCTHHLLRNTTLEDASAKLPRALWIAILAAMIIATITLSSGPDRAFIYFQF